MNRRSPLASLDLSDDRVSPDGDFLVAKLAETRRELITAHERMDQAENAVRGLLGMVAKLGGHPDVTPELHRFLLTHPRVIDAQEILL